MFLHRLMNDRRPPRPAARGPLASALAGHRRSPRTTAGALIVFLAALAAIAPPAALASGAAHRAARRGAVASHLIAAARRELARHVREIVVGSEDAPDIARYRAATAGAVAGAPWSGAFVSYVARQAGAPVGPKGTGLTLASDIRGWAQATHRWRHTPAPGEILVQDHHVAIVEAVFRHRQLTTIEGGVGGAVRRRLRSFSDAQGYVALAPSPRFRARRLRAVPADVRREPLTARISAYPGLSVPANKPLTLTSEDSSGRGARLTWDFGDGAAPAHGQTVTHVFVANGSYTVSLILSDGRRRSRMTRVVNVRTGGPRAVLKLSPDHAKVGQPVRAYATSSTDFDATIASFSWDSGDGGFTTGGALPVFTYSAPGVYTVRLRVTDDAGRIDEADAQAVIGGPSPPTATVSCDHSSLGVGQRVQCTVTASPGDGAINSYQWDDGQGAGFQAGTTSFATTFRSGGSHTIRIRVADDAGQSALASAPMTVVDQPPTARIRTGGSSLLTATNLGFDGSSSSDSDGKIVAYAWNFGDGGTANTAAPQHAYARAGTYTVTLTVTDDAGLTASTHQTVTIADRPPLAAFSVGGSARVGATVTVDGSSSSDPDGVVVAYSWSFGDGASATGPTAGHRYAAAGSYRVRLTVTDDSGKTASTSHTVSVSP
ncbi:MAG: PKD domain-containing protein [Actinobacteria bacterium]|nr:MAG: PKD domain-containing protein [Actinomycetota bacterium]